MPMEFWTENILMYILIACCFLLTLSARPGNELLFIVACGYAVFTDFTRYSLTLLCFLAVLIYFSRHWKLLLRLCGVSTESVSARTIQVIIGLVMGSLMLSPLTW